MDYVIGENTQNYLSIVEMSKHAQVDYITHGMGVSRLQIMGQ
jgi:hypothetical protein